MTETGELDLLLFEVGGKTFGAEATSVLRIEPPGEAVETKALGSVVGKGRALVVATEAGEGRMKVDCVRGVRTIKLQSLRQLPAAVAAQPFAIGVWLDGDNPILLIDLIEMLKFQGRL